MADIYIIAGPPGIGKSTLGYRSMPPEMDILNEDEMRFKYKAQGYADYNEYSIHRIRDTVRWNLIKDNDFALELNLGFKHQFEYTLSLKRLNFDNKLHIILFFTDDVDLCKRRAKKRYESGRHLVEPETIDEMYANTLPLLKANFEAVDHLILLDANRHDELNPVAEYDKEAASF
jgi:predicted ABC-type ATPase